MRYSYKCEDGHITVHMCRVKDMPREIECEECGKTAKRSMADDIKTAKIHIPDYMKSCSETNKDNGANLSYIKDRMKNSPTGRRKIYHRGGITK
jgi:predicted nucleic acid-binding Zn ribbon protein